MQTNHRETEYNYITDGIYLGTNECCNLHFQEKLAKEGIWADISLESERVEAPSGIGSYIWIPVVDKTPPSQDQLEFGVGVLKKLVSLKKKIYLHCKNGHGRSPTLMAAYLIHMGMAVNEALEFIKGRRPSIHLQDSQVAALNTFASKELDK